MSGRKTPFILVPWQYDFMQAVLALALKQCSGDIGKAVFIFPHSRPARYLERLIRQDERVKKPCLMPQMLPIGKIFQAIWAEHHQPASGIGLLDRVGLLLDCVREEQKASPGNLDKLPTDDAETFFPWGVRLANLFEECFINNRTPSGFLHLEDELMPFAAAILSRLSGLYSRYMAGLEANGWTTPGFTAQKAVRALEHGASASALGGGKRIYIAGFYSPSGAEDALFKKLWSEYAATVLWHADPALMEHNAHWSCSELEVWRKSWGTGLELFVPEVLASNAEPAYTEPDIAFYGGYDVHSQLAAMRKILEQQSLSGGIEADKADDENEHVFADTAVILPDTSLLLPCLHHIGTSDVNISMGYPLTNTPLNRFFESILALHQHARSGGQYWKDCIQLLRQPYVKMLHGAFGENSAAPWRELLLRTENALRRGKRYVHLPELMQKAMEDMDVGENLEILNQQYETFKANFVDAFLAANSLAALAKSLENICTLLLNAGGEVWPRFPIDAECLYRFMQSVIPELRESALATEPLPQSALFSIVRELIRALRVPFDAYPLTALQIMGLLESRLLSFKTVLILDATDDLLPGAIQNDPLLPDSLRAELGLPNSARRQQLNAYYFFRLLNGAKKVHLFWQEGVEPRGVQDAKKLKSRFIEELLWKHERKLGRLLAPDQAQTPRHDQAADNVPMFTDGPLHYIGSNVAPVLLRHRALQAGDAERARIRRILSAPVSATRLNSYLRCPAAFYYRNILGLKPLDGVNEDDDPLAVGDIFHQTLRDFYSDKLGRNLNGKTISRTELANIFLRRLQAHGSMAELPADVAAMLRVSGPRRLGEYLSNQPENTTVLALETPMHAPLAGANGATYQLTGQMDRIDLRMHDGTEKLVILDYKTGNISSLNPDFWQDSGIWKALEDGAADFADQGFFNAIAEQMDDVQLPMYLYLASFGRMEREKGLVHAGFADASNVCNAGWVSLRQSGKEIFMLPEDMPESDKRDIIENKTELVLDYLLGHMAASKTFFTRPSRLCDYCDFREICIVL